MPQWFLAGLRRGVITTRYPGRPDASASGLPTPPVFRPEFLTRPASGLAASGPSAAVGAERAASRPIPPPDPCGRGAAPRDGAEVRGRPGCDTPEARGGREAAPPEVIVADMLVAICPSGALRREGDEMIFDVGACTTCGRCAQAEPAAVGVSGEFELAATDRAQLVKRIPLHFQESQR